eukprot:s5323_g2.t1
MEPAADADTEADTWNPNSEAPESVANSLRFLREAWRPTLLKPSDAEIELLAAKAAEAEREAAVVLTRFLGPVAWRQGAIDTQHPEFPYPNPDRKSESPGATTTPAMELFGTAWSGYTPEERQHADNLRIYDAIGIPLFCPWYLILGKLFATEDALYEAAPDTFSTGLRLVLAVVACFVLFLHSQAVPKPSKDADAFYVQKKIGHWVYLTRHCIAMQVLTLLAPPPGLAVCRGIEAIGFPAFKLLLCAAFKKFFIGKGFQLSPMLGAMTNGLCICVGALGWFVTMQYFSLVVPHEGFKSECKKWQERGVAFEQVQHVVHVPPFFVGALDLFIRPSSLLTRALRMSSCLQFGAFYVVVYVLVFMGNYQLTGKWPYAFMDAFGTNVAKWAKFITMQALLIIAIIMALARQSAEVAELQRRVDHGYQELNLDRRSLHALELGLDRQQQSLDILQGESAQTRPQHSSTPPHA